MSRYETLFIEQQLGEGIKKEKIKKKLLERGFLDEKEIDDALEIIQEKLHYQKGGVDGNFVLKNNIQSGSREKSYGKFFIQSIFLFILILTVYLGSQLW